MYTKVIIDDLKSSQSDVKDLNSVIEGKKFIAAQHKLSELTPRDPSVWSKTPYEKAMLKKAKLNKN